MRDSISEIDYFEDFRMNTGSEGIKYNLLYSTPPKKTANFHQFKFKIKSVFLASKIKIERKKKEKNILCELNV